MLYHPLGLVTCYLERNMPSHLVVMEVIIGDHTLTLLVIMYIIMKEVEILRVDMDNYINLIVILFIIMS